MKVAVLDDYDGSIAKLDCWSRLRGEAQVDIFQTPRPAYALADYDVLVTVRERTLLTREFLGETKALKHLALTGRLSGQADLEALKEKGVAVSFTEGSGPAAAELTIALLAGALKHLQRNHASVRGGGWQCGPGLSLAGKTLGVLGLGRVGSKVAQFGKLMDMKVVSWGPTPDNGRSAKFGLERLELDAVLERSDALAICLRLSDKTRGLLGAAELKRLRDGATIVNTSRAEIIDRDALYHELGSGRLNAALDVFHTEPLPASDPVRTYSNVLLSPHMGYVTNEVYQTFFGQVVENILAWKRGEPYRDALKD